MILDAKVWLFCGIWNWSTIMVILGWQLWFVGFSWTTHCRWLERVRSSKCGVPGGKRYRNYEKKKKHTSYFFSTFSDDHASTTPKRFIKTQKNFFFYYKHCLLCRHQLLEIPLQRVQTGAVVDGLGMFFFIWDLDYLTSFFYNFKGRFALFHIWKL